MKQKIEVEVDVLDGYEIASHTKTAKIGTVVCGQTNTLVIDVQLAKDWVWPEWLKGEWLAMDEDGKWFVFVSEPERSEAYRMWETNTHDDYCEVSPTFMHFTPPPCTDWRQSKRRRPV